MKKKSRKPKDYLIESVLEELKNSPDDSVVIGPDGMGGKDIEKQDLDNNAFLMNGEGNSQPAISEAPKNEPIDDAANDRTVLLGQQAPSSHVTSKPAATPKTSISQEHQVIQLDETEAAIPGQLAESDKTKVAPSRARAGAEEPKISYGGGKGKSSPYEAQFAQAENLKLAQQRILELEKTNENLRKENEVLSSASEITRQKMDELVSQLYQLEKQKQELRATNESELQIFKDGLSAKESENLRLRAKVEELESRLSKDLRKVRVRERELENRLELSKAEKTALLRAKDEAILELKRKNENFEVEIERYQNRVIELGQKIELNQEQFARTVRALRLALTNLEVSDGTSSSITLAPLKKAE